MKQHVLPEMIDVLRDLVHIPSPSGFTEAAIRYAEQFLQRSGIATARTHKGALLATLPGKDEAQHRLLTAHVDTLGAMVKEVKKQGRLKIALVGGFSHHAIEGEYCLIHKADGTTISGTIVMHQSSVHVYKDARTAERNEKNIEVRLDARTQSRFETESLGIAVGDFISFAPRFMHTDSGFIKSRHLDDKASVAIVLQLLKEMAAEGRELPYTTHVLISNNEEIGYGGNASIPPEVVEYVAVDMGAIGDGQATDEYSVSICAKDSSGPYHYGLRQHLVRLCQQQGIDYKVDIYPYYGSDASAAMRAGYDLVHALVGPGIEGSHAMERTHEQALRETYRLLDAYIQSEISSQRPEVGKNASSKK